MATKETHPYPKDFEKEYTTWDEETKKKVACIGWSITTLVMYKVIRKLDKEREIKE